MRYHCWPGPTQPRSVGEYLPQLLSSMTLGGVRNLVDAGLYPEDSLVTDKVFALFLVSLFGKTALPLPHNPLHLIILTIIFTELLKFFRSASNDPEQRPKNTQKIKYQYDFIIIGKYLTLFDINVTCLGCSEGYHQTTTDQQRPQICMFCCSAVLTLTRSSLTRNIEH